MKTVLFLYVVILYYYEPLYLMLKFLKFANVPVLIFLQSMAKEKEKFLYNILTQFVIYRHIDSNMFGR